MINSFLEIVVPYTAFAIFIVGIIIRIVNWAKSPVPLKIVTTCGQQYTLPFIKRTVWDKLEAPYTKLGVIPRMFFEVFMFRSLFRNTRYYIDKHEARDTRWLWGFALMFHASFFITLIRHLRFFTDPVPKWVIALSELEALKIFVPSVYITGITGLIGLTYLLLRRLYGKKERTLSYPSDYFPLLLLISIFITGLWMRYISKIPLINVKKLALGLVTLHPVAPDVHPLFLLHFMLVCTLIAYFPFSKLVHAIGIFFSTTRVMPNNCRAVRHVNPWNPPYEGITWEEYYQNYKDQLDEIAEKGYVIRPEIEEEEEEEEEEEGGEKE